MRNKLVVAAVLSLLLSAAVPVTVRAETGQEEVPTEYVYNVSYDYYNSDGSYAVRELTYTANVPICFVWTDEGECYGPGGQKFARYNMGMYYYLSSGKDGNMGVHRTGRVEYRKADGSLKNEGELNDYSYASPLPYCHGWVQGEAYYRFETDAPIFSSHDAALHYLTTGDASGAVNHPAYKEEHDFTADRYDPSIPTPELKSISYDGFTVVNNDGYLVDVVLESRFYGVKLEKKVMTWFAVADTDWVYSSHYYNFADVGSQKVDKVDLPMQRGVSPRDELVEDFKRWSLQYPSVKHVPGYSWFKKVEGTSYPLHLYGSYEGKGQVDAALAMSEQAQASYYVRFRDDSGTCGPWVLYEFRDRLSTNKTLVQIGQVEVDEDGNVVVDAGGRPVVKDVLTGSQDYGTGDVDLSSGSLLDFDVLEFLGLGKVGEMFDYIRTTLDKATASLGSFGSLMAACLSFLPQELVGFIVLGIVLMILVGLVKVVRG